MSTASGPLTGLRVIELGHFIAGPFAARVLADMGADVIKVEPPRAGDPVRSWGERVDGKSLWWSVHGRNKRCVTLDLRHPKGPALALRLVAEADVVIENFRPGQLARWGLGDEALRAANPDVVIAHVSGYGQTGPYAGRAAFGVVGEAIGGIRHLTAYPKEISDLPPVRTGISLGDSVAGLYAALGVLAALLERRSGSGGARPPRTVDAALTEAVFSLMEGCLPEYGYLGKVREPTGATLPTNAPSNAYRCRDGQWLLIAANSDGLFRRLSRLIGRPELADEPRFVDNPGRVRHAGELDRIIGAWTATVDADTAERRLAEADVPSTRIYTIADCAEDRQFRERGMIVPVADGQFARPVLHPAPVPAFEGDERAQAVRWAGPAIGAHNREVYGDLLGLAPEAVAALEGEGAI